MILAWRKGGAVQGQGNVAIVVPRTEVAEDEIKREENPYKVDVPKPEKVE